VPTASDRGLIDRSSGLPRAVLVLLSLAAAVLATYLAMEATPGLEWGSYAAILIVSMCIVMCLAWLYRVKTIAFVWIAAAGGYIGSFAAAVHRDWDIITETASHHHYDYATEMLMLPEYFFSAVVGALAGCLMIGFSLIALKLQGIRAIRPAVE
jgi:hypothetical protein